MAAVWPKFIAAIALLLGLTLTAVVFVKVWSAELLTFAFVPRTAFVAPPPLPAGAYVPDTLWLARPDGQGRRRADDTSGLLPDGWIDHRPRRRAPRCFSCRPPPVLLAATGTIRSTTAMAAHAITCSSV